MSKDWTGNKPTAFVQMGASNHSILEREENDFYATEPSAIDDLLSVGTFSKNIWECAVGQGHLAERLKEHGYTVKCTDLVDRGYPNTEIVDFLKEKYDFDGEFQKLSKQAGNSIVVDVLEELFCMLLDEKGDFYL